MSGGGVSIYYSHTLKMIFFSYAQGKSFLAPLNTVEESLKGNLEFLSEHSQIFFFKLNIRTYLFMDYIILYTVYLCIY